MTCKIHMLCTPIPIIYSHSLPYSYVASLLFSKHAKDPPALMLRAFGPQMSLSPFPSALPPGSHTLDFPSGLNSLLTTF